MPENWDLERREEKRQQASTFASVPEKRGCLFYLRPKADRSWSDPSCCCCCCWGTFFQDEPPSYKTGVTSHSEIIVGDAPPSIFFHPVRGGGSHLILKSLWLINHPVFFVTLSVSGGVTPHSEIIVGDEPPCVVGLYEKWGFHSSPFSEIMKEESK